MRLVWHHQAWEDYLWWHEQDRKTLKRVNAILKDIMRGGHDGLGKPEALRHELSGYWSRRITSEHRVVYQSDDSTVVILACRYHYGR